MTFRDLAVGDRFVFYGQPGAPRPSIKTGARTFYIEGDSGYEGTCGRVGVGDNPVRRIPPKGDA